MRYFCLSLVGAISASIHNNKNLQKSCPCDFCDFSNCVFSYSPCTPFIHENFVFVQHIIVLWRSGASFRPSFAFFNKKRPSCDGLFLLNLVGATMSKFAKCQHRQIVTNAPQVWRILRKTEGKIRT